MIKKRKVIKEGYVFTRIFNHKPHEHICSLCEKNDSGSCLLSRGMFNFCNLIAPITYKGNLMYIIKKEEVD